jgi:hypothetical protein
MLSHIGLPMDEDEKYDYYMDTYGTSEVPQLGLGIGRKNDEMRYKSYLPPLRPRHRKAIPHDHTLNIFESGLSGSAVAKEIDLKAEQVEHRKRQWAVIVDQKRVLEEEERRRQIEEAQAQIAIQEKEEMEKFRAAMAVEVDEAMSRYSHSNNSPNTHPTKPPAQGGDESHVTIFSPDHRSGSSAASPDHSRKVAAHFMLMTSSAKSSES